MTTTKTTKPSPRSLNFLTKLVEERQAGQFGQTKAQDLAELTRWLATPRTQKEVSAMIDRLLARPKREEKAAATAPAPSAPPAYKPYPSVPEAVPSSKFALLTELLTEAPESWRKQEYLFFEVKKLRGKRVIRRLTGAPGRFNRTALPSALALELYGHLENEKFAWQASKTFSEIYKVCGRCAAELTDDLSREHGFGLTCWNLMEPWRKAAGL